MSPDILCSDSEYILHLVTLVIPGIILYIIVVPIIAVRKMNNMAKVMYISGYQLQSEQTLKDRRDINDVKSLYGFFFSGLNLGGQTFTIKKEAEEDGDEENTKTKTEGEAGAPKKTLAKKCSKCFSGFLMPIQGGVTVPVDSTSKISLASGNDGQEFVKSFFYWEFILHIQKTILQIMIVYMAKIELN